MIEKYKTVSTKELSKNPWWDYKLDEYILPNGKIGKYYYVETKGSTFIIPLFSNDKFILTKQFRYLNNRESIEFPGGGIKSGITQIENALAELE